LQQLGQSYMETEEHDEARKALTQGLARAKKVRDHHAQAEISGLLDQMEGHD
jgi:Tfp pilus assembly protein PilF